MEVPGPGPEGALLRPRLLPRWRPSSCGRGSGRWRAGSRRSRTPGDFVEYEILDQSVIVVRTDDGGVRAFQNACRHRGVKVVEGRGTCDERVHLPVPRLVLRPRRHEHLRPAARAPSPSTTCSPATSTSCRCGARCGAACAWINLDDDAPPLRECIEPAATILDAWKVESMRAEWWYACRLPVNWKLAEEAFMEQYHVVETHPQLASPARYPPRDGRPFDPRAFIDAELHYLRTMSEGMAGMVHANDVRIAEGLRDIELPADPDAGHGRRGTARSTTRSSTWHRERGPRHPRPQRARGARA